VKSDNLFKEMLCHSMFTGLKMQVTCVGACFLTQQLDCLCITASTTKEMVPAMKQDKCSARLLGIWPVKLF